MSSSETEVRLRKMRGTGPDMDENIGYRDTIKESVARVRRLRRALEEWREVLAPLYSILIWRQDWHPVLISGLITAVFSCIWYVEPPLLTLIAVLGMTITTADYVVPAVCQAIFRADDWTATKEREFERVCQLIADMVSGGEQFSDNLAGWKKEKPNVYFCTVAFVLCVLAWLGNNVSSLLLAFTVAQLIALYPGLKHRGLLKRYMAESIMFVTSKLRSQRPPPADGKPVKSE